MERRLGKSLRACILHHITLFVYCKLLSFESLLNRLTVVEAGIERQQDILPREFSGKIEPLPQIDRNAEKLLGEVFRDRDDLIQVSSRGAKCPRKLKRWNWRRRHCKFRRLTKNTFNGFPVAMLRIADGVLHIILFRIKRSDFCRRASSKRQDGFGSCFHSFDRTLE